jgi:hypothetical protein
MDRPRLKPVSTVFKCYTTATGWERQDMDALTKLIYKSEITDVLLRYARNVDRREWDAVRKSYHDGATDHHGDFRGNADDFIAWVSNNHKNLPKSTHFLGNILIEFASDTEALAETYYLGMLELSATSEEHRRRLLNGRDTTAESIEIDVLGRYLDRFERRDGQWRVVERQVIYDVIRTRESGSQPVKEGWALGTRDPDDPVLLMRKRMGITA